MDGVSHDELYPYAFKNKHWKGLLIEPVSDYFEQLKNNYENRENLIFENVAISCSSEDKEIYTVDRSAIQNGNVPFWCNGISSFNPNSSIISAEGIKDKVQTEVVKCCTFKDIVNKYHLQKIDILQIDAEGSDYDILNQVWECGFRPNLIYIEIVHMEPDQVSNVYQLLHSNGYETKVQADNILAIKKYQSNFVYLKPKKVAFYVENYWALGSIHSFLCKELSEYNIDADIIDYKKNFSLNDFKKFNDLYDIFVTLPGSFIFKLVNEYQIPYEKIIGIAHGKYDLDAGVFYQNDFDSLLGFGVIASSLCQDAKKLGIEREMKILRNGIDFNYFYQPISSTLSTIGYAGVNNQYTWDKKEWKRSDLVSRIVNKLNLPLLTTDAKIHYTNMPDYYFGIDCVIVSSDQNESCGLPLMEAAASGRLPISARVGILNEFNNPPGLILPMESNEFVSEGVEGIRELMNNPTKFRQMCQEAQDFAREHYDWKAVIGMWADLLTNP